MVTEEKEKFKKYINELIDQLPNDFLDGFYEHHYSNDTAQGITFVLEGHIRKEKIKQ